MTVVLSGSLAFDYIMNFPGYFEDHILPDKIHMLNVSFLVESLDRQRGGVAGNIGYTLGLLRQPCRLIGPVGIDFDEYSSRMLELGIDTSGVWTVGDEVTASAFITTDRADNQITGFFPGAMGHAGQQSILDHLEGVSIAVVSPTAPEAMELHVRELRGTGTPYAYDPGQQIVALSPEALREGVEGAELVIGNDYEFAMIEEKTELTREEIISTVPTCVVTFGDLGSRIFSQGEVYDIPAVEAWSVVDPTGAGDGYRAGLLASYVHNLPWEIAGRIGSTAATYVVEQKGTQEHDYTEADFRARFGEAFPEFEDALDRLFGE